MSCTDTDIFDIGDLVRCEGRFANLIGTLVDPATVTFKVKDPNGDVTTYLYDTDAQVIKQDTGIYYVDVSVDKAGTWYYRFNSTGTSQAAGETAFTVAVSQF